jgi:hypothetical protein
LHFVHKFNGGKSMNDTTSENFSDEVLASPNAAARLIRDTFRTALQQGFENAEGRKACNLDLIVEAMVAKAVAGDLAAAREVFDRIGGKPAQGVRPPPEPRKYIISWKGDEG